jgi:hypothetical protein
MDLEPAPVTGGGRLPQGLEIGQLARRRDRRERARRAGHDPAAPLATGRAQPAHQRS